MTDQDKEKWIEDNYEAWKMFCFYAIKVANTGRKFGFKAVAERVRWETYFEKAEVYKWNNSVTSYAGKKFLEMYPQFRNQVTIKGEK